jgi:replication-associated recombination protein RarA
MSALFEKHRPRDWSEVVGHDKVVRLIKAKIANNDLAGRAYWITGNSGSGKTTLALLIAQELAEPINIIELDAGQVTPATLNDLRPMLRTFGIGKKTGRVVIVNEAHGLRKDTIRQLLVMLEPIALHVCWIFTTTGEGQQSLLFDGIDGGPLMSRCVPFRLRAENCLEGFAKRAQEIATMEGLTDFDSLSVFVSLAKRCGCNFRAILSEIEAGACLREDALQPA